MSSFSNNPDFNISSTFTTSIKVGSTLSFAKLATIFFKALEVALDNGANAVPEAPEVPVVGVVVLAVVALLAVVVAGLEGVVAVG
jgi:hypothetical protein